MRIRHFSLLGGRRLDGLKRDLPRTKETDLVVVYGSYAKGKTTFLDALCAAKERIGEYGSPDGRWGALVGKAGAAKVQLQFEASEAERTRAGLSDPLLGAEAILGKSFGAGEPNKVLSALLSQRGDAERGSVHYLHDTRDLGSPVSHGARDTSFAEQVTSRNSKFSELFDIMDQPDRAPSREVGFKRFSELFPDLEIAGLRRNGMSFIPTIRDAESGTERSYYELSCSQRHGFLSALYSARHPIVDSIFLIDAPELGFGETGAVDLVRGLLRWTERTQLIVATSSRAVCAMPEVAHVVELP
jgi:hypothetical protein